MEQKPMVMNIGNMVMATERSKAKVNSIIELANTIQKDERKKERIKRHECKGCFYTSRIGGSAMTYRKCMSCGKNVLYSSTNTDVLCLECAATGGLCKHCGGDIEMRVRRKEWPKPLTE